MIKKENVAGMFYADDVKVLKDTIANYINEAKLPDDIEGEIVGVVAPHAGYVYSGPVAAYSYKLLQGKSYDAVIVMAPSHYFPIDEIAVYDGDAFRTPLGDVEINKEVLNDLLKDEVVVANNKVFEREHALEVQLPFLKFVMPDVKIVPLIYGQVSMDKIEAIAASLAKISSFKNILVVTSTDLSHYHPYDNAKSIDSATVEHILALDSESLINDLMAKTCEACGYAPLLASMEYYSLRGAKAKKLFYANSGDTAGDKDRVVGYVSIAGLLSDKDKEASSDALSDTNKKDLLNLARESISVYLQNKKKLKPNLNDEVFEQVRGAFVTLHKNGDLRGCIGNYGRGPLKNTIVDMAISAATADPRFPAVKLEELEQLDIEISVLSPLRVVESADDIVLGKHGVIVSKGFRQGVFLPQVADETGWTKDEFLSYLCAHKAGLDPDAWKDRSTTLKVFTADVFSEEDFK